MVRLSEMTLAELPQYLLGGITLGKQRGGPLNKKECEEEFARRKKKGLENQVLGNGGFEIPVRANVKGNGGKLGEDEKILPQSIWKKGKGILVPVRDICHGLAVEKDVGGSRQPGQDGQSLKKKTKPFCLLR